jgi:hypothetical protein
VLLGIEIGDGGTIVEPTDDGGAGIVVVVVGGRVVVVVGELTVEAE